MEDKEKKPKRKIIPNKTKMPEQPPQERVKNFKEVPLGYSEDQAVEEATRCIQCKNRPCVEGCPVEIDIPDFIALIAERKFVEAARKMKEKMLFPLSVAGFVLRKFNAKASALWGRKMNRWPLAAWNGLSLTGKEKIRWFKRLLAQRPGARKLQS
jgi:sulfide dehydrogenase (flavoprotein) subunit SudA (EC 1.97.-.-)